MIDFIVDKIVIPLFILFILATLISVPVLFVQHRQHEAFLKDCFMQKHRTKACEYALWRYENRPKTRPTIVPMPVVVR